MSKEDLIAWRTIVQILIQTGYYNLYEEEVQRIANVLKKVGSDKQ